MFRIKSFLVTFSLALGLVAGSVSPAWAGHDAAQKVKEGSEEAWDGTKEGSEEAWDGTKEGSEEAWKKTKEGSKEAWEKTKEGVVKGAHGADHDLTPTIKNYFGEAGEDT
ncbi:MAG: hypothetical protein CL938_06080, partial [Deltaproteobacteria bacterium]|nr:hypothetical protein [Deltaproteobacteria bacterium]